MDLVVCGCNRTGTSFLTKTLVDAGLKILYPLVPSNAGNPEGYFEPVAFKICVEDYIRASPYRNDIPLLFLKRMMGRYGNWVWKYPGAVFMLPELNTVAKDMVAVSIRRDKAKTIASMIKHAEVTNQLPANYGYYSDWFDRANQAFYDYNGPKLSVAFEDLIRQPKETARFILVSCGLLSS